MPSETRPLPRSPALSGPRPLSLKRSVFLRMLLITLAAVLLFYFMGLAINVIGIRNIRNDMQTALQTHAEYAADQLDREMDRLKFFMLETVSDKQLLRFSISYEILSDWERLSFVKTLSAQEYLIKRSSSLVDSVMILFPAIGKTILTEQAQYIDLDPEILEQLLIRSERGKVSVTEWNGRIWLLLPRYDGSNPMFLVAFSVTSEDLSAWLQKLANNQAPDLVLTREDGSVLADCGNGTAIHGSDSGENRLEASKALSSAPFFLTAYSRIDRAMAPFRLYRIFLWVLTLLAAGLLTAYLLYYRRYIMRPLNDIFDTMRQAGEDGRFRIRNKGTEYDDIYAQFNDMVGHIEDLAGQLYEERYRAQKAELKQLQMQIDPHFLYNSLYMIYRMAQSEGNKDIANVSLNLSNYYRYITKMPEQIVPLRDEIRHVTNYLEIQRIRFEPRIRVEIEPLPEDIAGEMIPSLIIQPIVENAFQHGVKDLEKDGVVSLRYETEETLFRVIVADNSGKMDEEKVRTLWEHVTDPASLDSSALCNLYRRMRLYEDSGEALELRCVNSGLTAILTFRRGGTAHEDTAGRG